MTKAAAALCAVMMLAGCKARDSSHLLINDETASLLDLSALSPDQLRDVCGQHVLIFFVGNAEALGEISFPSDAARQRFSESDMAKWRQAEDRREWDYFRAVLARLAELKGALARPEPACAAIATSPDAAGTVTLIGLTDGPNFSIDPATGAVTTGVKDSAAHSWHFGYNSDDQGTLRWGQLAEDSWRLLDGRLATSDGSPYEDSLPDLYLAAVASVPDLAQRYLPPGASFTQESYFYKSHSAPASNAPSFTFPNDQPDLALPSITNVYRDPRHFQSTDRISFLLDSVGANGAPVAGNLVQLLWSPGTVCRQFRAAAAISGCLAGLASDSGGAGAPSKAQGAGDPSGTQGAGDPSGTQGAGDPSGTQGAGDPSGTQGAGDPSGTQGAGDPSGTQAISGLTLGNSFWLGATQGSKGLIVLTGDAGALRQSAATAPGAPEAFRVLGRGLSISMPDTLQGVLGTAPLKVAAGTGPTMLFFDSCFGMEPWRTKRNILANGVPGNTYDLVALYNRNPLGIDAVSYKELDGFQVAYLALRITGDAKANAGVWDWIRAHPDAGLPQDLRDQLDRANSDLGSLSTALMRNAPTSGEKTYQRITGSYAPCKVSSDARTLSCAVEYALGTGDYETMNMDDVAMELERLLPELQAPLDNRLDSSVRVKNLSVDAGVAILQSYKLTDGASQYADVKTSVERALYDLDETLLFTVSASAAEISAALGPSAQEDPDRLALLRQSPFSPAEASLERRCLGRYFRAVASQIRSRAIQPQGLDGATLRQWIFRPELVPLMTVYARNALRVSRRTDGSKTPGFITTATGALRYVQGDAIWILPTFHQGIRESHDDGLAQLLPAPDKINGLQDAAANQDRQAVTNLLDAMVGNLDQDCQPKS